jgi:hypothetical protein
MPFNRRMAISRPLGLAMVLPVALGVLITNVAFDEPSLAASPAPATIWGGRVPGSPADSDRTEAEVGTRFTAETSGEVTAIRFYKLPQTRGVHLGKLRHANGALLASARFTDETASGWQVVRLVRPVKLVAGRQYIVSYTAPRGGYANDPGVFARGETITRGPLTAIKGSYNNGTTTTWTNSAYYADVVFRYEFPGPSNTGVPAGVKLTPYTGPCTITVRNTVIDSKIIKDCRMDIRTTGVRILNSKIIKGSLNVSGGSSSATVEDTEIEIGSPKHRGITGPNWTVRRVNIHGGYSGIWCTNCTVEYTYIHDQDRDDTGTQHASAIRMDQGLTLRHSTILCNAPVIGDAGCSADLTGYGDFAPVKNNTIEGNLFKATAPSGGFCAYGGSSPGKPYSSQASNIVFKNNVFERGQNRKCGSYGPITAFDSSRPGNVWVGNKWDDGTPIPPEF